MRCFLLKQCGEITTLLSLLSMGLIVVGAIISSYAARQETRLTSKAATTLSDVPSDNITAFCLGEGGNSKIATTLCLPWGQQISSPIGEVGRSVGEHYCCELCDSATSGNWVNTCYRPVDQNKNYKGPCNSDAGVAFPLLCMQDPGDHRWKWVSQNDKGECNTACAGESTVPTPIPTATTIPIQPTPTTSSSEIPSPTAIPSITPRIGEPISVIPTPTFKSGPTSLLTPTSVPNPSIILVPTSTIMPSVVSPTTVNISPTPQVISRCEFLEGDMGGMDRRLDWVFLPDSYPNAQEFRNEVRAAINYIKETNLGPSRINKFNFWMIPDVSQNYNVSEQNGLPYWNREAASDKMRSCQGDAYTIITHDGLIPLRQGWIGLAFFFSGESIIVHGASYAARHEGGHMIAGLNDEYVYMDSGILPKSSPPGAHPHINCSDQSAGENRPCPKWSRYTNPEIRCYPGCTYSNWYRSTFDSTMRTSTNSIFNSLSLEGWDQALQRFK